MKNRPVHPLKAWRVERGFLQEEAAIHVGVRQQEWSRYERGAVLPRREPFRRIVKRTGVSPCVIVTAYLYGPKKPEW